MGSADSLASRISKPKKPLSQRRRRQLGTKRFLEQHQKDFQALTLSAPERERLRKEELERKAEMDRNSEIGRLRKQGIEVSAAELDQLMKRRKQKQTAGRSHRPPAGGTSTKSAELEDNPVNALISGLRPENRRKSQQPVKNINSSDLRDEKKTPAQTKGQKKTSRASGGAAVKKEDATESKGALPERMMLMGAAKDAALVVEPQDTQKSFHILNVSKPPVLVLQNLASGTSTADVKVFIHY